MPFLYRRVCRKTDFILSSLFLKMTGNKVALALAGQNSRWEAWQSIALALSRLGQEHPAPRTAPAPPQAHRTLPSASGSLAIGSLDFPLQAANFPTHKPNLPRSLSCGFSSARGSPGRVGNSADPSLERRWLENLDPACGAACFYLLSAALVLCGSGSAGNESQLHLSSPSCVFSEAHILLH